MTQNINILGSNLIMCWGVDLGPWLNLSEIQIPYFERGGDTPIGCGNEILWDNVSEPSAQCLIQWDIQQYIIHSFLFSSPPLFLLSFLLKHLLN